MRKKVIIAAVVVIIAILLVLEYRVMRKFMTVEEPSKQHELSVNTEAGTSSVIKVIEDDDSISTYEDTEAVAEEVSTEQVRETATEIVTTEDSTEEPDNVIVAEVDVDIPDFTKGTTGSSNTLKGNSYHAQSGDTLSTADSCYSVSKSNNRIELVNGSNSQYKVWSICALNGDTLFTSDKIAPNSAVTWEVPSEYLNSDYAEFKLITSIFDSEDDESKVTVMHSKLKLNVED